ncbi:hypothetical protein V5S96_05150 [Corynebacterium mastitidis]|uniref:ABC-2 type transport system permease protein n=1 Tax=Corynebacterium mastitidis TaxID=161890 RepID=A0ABU8NYB1_9CORY
MPHALPRALRAELLRTRRSAVAWLPLLGLLVGGLSVLLPVVASGRHDASVLLSWQGMYVTGMAAPLTALFCVLAERRERAARCGGTQWRPFSPWALRAARVLVLAGLLGIFTALSFGACWCVALAQGYDGAGLIALAGLVSWWGQVGVLCVFLLLARATGAVFPLLAAVVWQVIGLLSAESPQWWAVPPAWPVRLVLPLLGTHVNLVPFAPGEVIPHPWSVLAACTLMNALALTVAVFCAPRSRWRAPGSGRQSGDTSAGIAYSPGGLDARPTRWGLLCAPMLAARRRGIYPLLLVTLAVLAYAAAMYPPFAVTGLTTFLLLPLGTAILPVMVWGGLAPAWRIAVLRRPGLRGAVALWHLGLVWGVCLASAVATLVAGESLDRAAARAALWCATGTVLALLFLLLTVRFSPGAALGLGVVSTIVSLTLGGDVLAATSLWVLALPSWGESALDPGRFPLALALCAALAAVLLPLLGRAYRRHEAAA